MMSRNKREGRYTGKTQWAMVEGWGLAGYRSDRHHRSKLGVRL